MTILAHVLSVGACSPLGMTARQLALLWRARKQEPRSMELEDKRGELVGACAAAGLPTDLYGYRRMVALAAPALMQAWLEDEDGEDVVPLCVALPEQGRPDDDARFGEQFISDLAAYCNLTIDPVDSVVVRHGHAGFAYALEEALQLLDQGIERVMVGAVDSYIHPEVLKWLDEECRLHGLHAEDGFVPGEGAAFLTLSLPPDIDRAERVHGLQPLALLTHVVSGEETTIASGEPNIGQTMTRMLRSIVGTPDDAQRIQWVLPDLNGERHRQHEWSLVGMRLLLSEHSVESALSIELGDVGAASGAMFACIVSSLWQMDASPCDEAGDVCDAAVIVLHAEGSERGALRLQAASPLSGTPQLSQSQAPTDRHRAHARGESRVDDGPEHPLREALTLAHAELGAATMRLAALPAGYERILLRTAIRDTTKQLLQFDGNGWRSTGASTQLRVAQRQLNKAADRVRSFETDTANEIASRLHRVADSLGGSYNPLLNALSTLPAYAQQADTPHQPFRASRGVPALHSVSTALPIAPDQPDVVAADNREQQRRGEKAGLVVLQAPKPANPTPLATTIDQLRRVGRDCMEELGALGNLCTLRHSDRWSRGMVAFEQRLLNDFDALVGLDGELIAHNLELFHFAMRKEVLDYARDAFVPDPFRTFARSFVLGSLEGTGGMRALMAALRTSHPSTTPAQTRALCLAANPAVTDSMRQLLRDDDPMMVLVALNVLRERGCDEMEAAAPLLNHEDDLVRQAAVALIAQSTQRDDAGALITSQLEREIEGAVIATILEGLVLLRKPLGTHEARRLITEDVALPGALERECRNRLLRLLGFAGERADGTLLAGALHAEPDEARALGWHGHPQSVEPLLVALERSHDKPEHREFCAAIAAALERITGAQLGQMEAASIEDERAMAETTTKPFDRYLPSSDPQRWRGWWQQQHTHFGNQRYRFGALYTPLATLEELAAYGAPMHVRHYAALELAAQTGQPPLAIRNWSTLQLTALDSLRTLLVSSNGQRPTVSPSPGRWLPDRQPA